MRDRTVFNQIRVVPGREGGWRVVGPAGVHATCDSQQDAERQGETLLRETGGGELVIYDARQRVHAVKRYAL